MDGLCMAAFTCLLFVSMVLLHSASSSRGLKFSSTGLRIQTVSIKSTVIRNRNLISLPNPTADPGPLERGEACSVKRNS